MQIKIGIVGSSQAGKTVYLATLLRLLIRGGGGDEASAVRMIATSDETETYRFWSGCHQFLYERGEWPPKNAPGYQSKFQIRLTDEAGGNHEVELMDLAGEDAERYLLNQLDPDVAPIREWYRQCDAFIFLIAPSDDKTRPFEDVSDLRIPAEDPQLHFVNRLVLSLTESSTAKVRQPTVFQFTRSDLFGNPEGNERVLWRKFFSHPQLVAARFENHEVFWCTSTGPLDRGDPLNPRPSRHKLAPKYVVEPLRWIVSTLQRRHDEAEAKRKEEELTLASAAASRQAREKRRKRLRAILVTAALLAISGGVTAERYHHAQIRLQEARDLLAMAANKPDGSRPQLELACGILNQLSWYAGPATLRQKLLIDASQMIQSLDIREFGKRLDQLSAASQSTLVDRTAFFDDTAAAIEACARIGDNPAARSPSDQLSLQKHGERLGALTELAVGQILRVPSRRNIQRSHALATRWIASPAGKLADAAQIERFVTHLVDAVCSMESVETQGTDDLFEGSQGLCARVVETLCTRFIENSVRTIKQTNVSQADGAKARAAIFSIAGTLSERNGAALKDHLAHIRACALLESVETSSAAPELMTHLQEVARLLSAEPGPASTALARRASEDCAVVTEALFESAAQRLAAGEDQAALVALEPVIAAANSTLMEGPTPRHQLNQVLQSWAKSLSPDDLDRPGVQRFCAALCGVMPRAEESPTIGPVVETYTGRGRFASAVYFIKAMPSLAWRDARLKSLTDAADQFIGNLVSRYVDAATSNSLRTDRIQQDNDAYLASIDSLNAYLKDIQRYDATSLPEFAERTRAASGLLRSLSTGVPAELASEQGRRTITGAYAECAAGKLENARVAAAQLSRFDRIALAKDVDRLDTTVFPLVKKLSAVAPTATHQERLAAYFAAADALQAHPSGGIDSGDAIQPISDAIVRRIGDEVTAWNGEIIGAVESAKWEDVKSGLMALNGTELGTRLRQFAGASLKKELEAVSAAVATKLLSTTDISNAEARSAAVLAVIWTPGREGILKNVAKGQGSGAVGLWAACQFGEEVRAGAERVASSTADRTANDVQQEVENAVLAAQRVWGDAASALLDDEVKRVLPGGNADTTLLSRYCFGNFRKPSYLRNLEALASFVKLAGSRRWYPQELQTRRQQMVDVMIACVARTDSSIPLVCRSLDVYPFRYIALSLESEKGAVIPVMPWIEAASRDAEISEAINEFIRVAGLQESEADIDGMLTVQPAPDDEKVFLVALKNWKHPVFKIDHVAENHFWYSYCADRLHGPQPKPTAKAIAEWYRFVLIQMVKTASCMCEPAASVPQQVRSLAADLRGAGARADLEVARRVLSRPRAVPKYNEFYIPPAFSGAGTK